jgi:hypothetical protein
MFWPFSKKRKISPMEELLDLAIEDLEDKWISFTKSSRFKNDILLSENIDNFAAPLVTFFKNRYMTLYQFGRRIFWYTVSEAITKSKSHAKAEVHKALEELESKYV